MVAVAKKSSIDRSGSEQLNIRMPSALLDRLDRIIEPYGLRRSDAIRQAVVEYIQRQESQHPHGGKADRR